MTLGITGGIGCGKSTAAGMFEAKGFKRIDMDRVIREEILVRPDILAQIRERFGAEVLAADGSVERSKLGAKVFADEAALRWLEELTHPPLYEYMRAKLVRQIAGAWVVEVPLLFEKNLENWFDFTVCVACAPAQQIARLEQRGLPHALAEQRISKQLPLARKIELADYVLWNEGTPEFLQDQVDHLVKTLPAGR